MVQRDGDGIRKYAQKLTMYNTKLQNTSTSGAELDNALLMVYNRYEKC